MRNCIEFTLENDDGDEIEHTLPAAWVICDRCQGNGKHVNPSVDGHGIGSEEWDEMGEEGQETYLSGGYDVPCEAGCKDGKILTIADDKALTVEERALAKQYVRKLWNQRRWDREDRRTRYMESGGSEGSW